MDVRTALTNLVNAFSLEDLSGLDPKQVKAIHDARNALSVPAGAGDFVALSPAVLAALRGDSPKSKYDPSTFNRDACLTILRRLDAQYRSKGVKRDRAAMEMVMGVGIALQVTGDDTLLQLWLRVCTLVAIQGVEIVEETANRELGT